MKNTGSIGKKEYKIYSNNVNAQAEMPVSQVAEMLIDSASRHAENNGFGYANLINNNHSWVLLRLVFELSHYPKVNDTVVVETWVEGFNKHFTSRNFKILTSGDEVLGYARSIWTVINMETRDAVDLSDYSAISEYITDYPCPIERPGRINNVEDKDAVDYQVKVSDLDVNRHLTSSKYIDHLLDRFSLETFDKERVARFEIQYISEARYGDDVYLMKQKIRENEFNLEMRSFNGESLCKCKCIFL